MKKVALYLMILNVAVFALNNILLIVGKLPREKFGLDVEITIIISVLASLWVYRKPDKVKWLGEKLEASHEANMTVSYVVSAICLFPAILFNSILIWR